jgi:hypothetical protein
LGTTKVRDVFEDNRSYGADEDKLQDYLSYDYLAGGVDSS